MSCAAFRELVLQEISRHFRVTGAGCSEAHLAAELGLELLQLRTCLAELAAACLVRVRTNAIAPIPDGQRLQALRDRARQVLTRAVRDGRITKPGACQRCATPTDRSRLRGHFKDPAQPLDVEWLCPSCYRVENQYKSGPPRRLAPPTSVRLPEVTLDAYCRRAQKTGDTVNALIQKVLIRNAPTDGAQG